MDNSNTKITGLPTSNNISRKIKKYVTNKKIPYIQNWQKLEKCGLLSFAIYQNEADYVKKMLAENINFYSIETLVEAIDKAIELKHVVILTHIIDCAELINKNTLLIKAFEISLNFNRLLIIKKLIDCYPNFFNGLEKAHALLLSQILDSFMIEGYVPGLKAIFEKKLSSMDINFYCRMAAKDNKPNLLTLLVSRFTNLLEPMTKGIILINLAEFGQKKALLHFFQITECKESDYIERALVKAIRKGHLECVRILLAQPIQWSYELIERSIDLALLNKQDVCLSAVIQAKMVLLSSIQLQDFVLNAYVNGCTQTVNKLREVNNDKLSSRTRGELLLSATKNNDVNLIEQLLKDKNHKIASPFKLRSYRLAESLEHQRLVSLFQVECLGIERIQKLPKQKTISEFEAETIQVLTFQFSRLKTRKEKPTDTSIFMPTPSLISNKY